MRKAMPHPNTFAAAKPAVARRSRAPQLRKARGFSLIEVLVTVLILAFGLLGVAGLLVKGMSNSASSESMSKANQLITDMADRMRANSVVALGASTEYRLAYTDSVPSSITSIALQDKKDWMNAIAAQLPAGAGKIDNVVAGGGRKVTIAVRWSACMGTLSAADQTACSDNSAAAYKYMEMEIRL